MFFLGGDGRKNLGLGAQPYASLQGFNQKSILGCKEYFNLISI